MIIVNVVPQGGIKQFFDYLKGNIGHCSKIKCIQYKNFYSLFKELKYDNKITFTCNTKEVYLFVLLSFFVDININLILHDYKIRKGSSFRERLLISLYEIFKKRFSNVIVHSKLAIDGTYLKMPYHQEETQEYKFKLLQFGRIEEYKNIDYLVDVISRIDSVSLIIAGQGVLKNKTLNLINSSKNISIINQYIDSNLLQCLIDSSDGISLLYNDITQTGLIDFGLKNKKAIILSNIEEFMLLPECEVIAHLDIDNIDNAVKQFNCFITKYNTIKNDIDSVFLACEPNQKKEWEEYINKIISF